MSTQRKSSSRQFLSRAGLVHHVRRAGLSVPAAVNPLVFRAVMPAVAALTKPVTPDVAAVQQPNPRSAAIVMRMIRGNVWHAVLGFRNFETGAIELRSYAQFGATAAERHDLCLVTFGDLYQMLERHDKNRGQGGHGVAAAPAPASPPAAASSPATGSTIVDESADRPGAGSDVAHSFVHLATRRCPKMLRALVGQIWRRVAVDSGDASAKAAGNPRDEESQRDRNDNKPSCDATAVYVANSELHCELVGMQSSFPLAHFVRHSDFPDPDLLDAITARLDEPPEPQRAHDGAVIDFGFSASPLQVATDASLGLRRPGAGLACVDQYGNWSASFASNLRDVSLAEVSSVLLALETFPSRPLNLLVDSQTAVRWLQTDDADVPSRARAVVAKTRARLAKSGSSVSWVRGHAGHHLNETADRLSRACRRDAGLTDAAIAKERGDWIVQDAFSEARRVAAPHYIDLRDSHLAEFITTKLDNLH